MTTLAARRRLRPGAIAGTVLLIVIGAIFAVPLAWLFLSSLKTTTSILSDTSPLTWRTFIPDSPTVENFISLFGTYGFGRNMMNSVVVTVMKVIGAVVVCTVAGYSFARMRFPGSSVLFYFCLACSFVPIEAILLPEYRLALALGIDNSYAGVVLPFMFSPFGVFLMRQAFRGLPNEMFEAAELDGAGVTRSFLAIAVPNVRPALVTLLLIQFIWAWNAYVWPLLVLQDPKMQVAQVALAQFKNVANQPLDGELFAASTAVTLPLVVLAIVLQRYYVQGMLMSGSK